MSLTTPSPRAVIVGMGVCTPIGASVQALCDTVLANRSAIGPSQRFDGTVFANIPMSVFDANQRFDVSQRHQRWMDRGAVFVLEALDEALGQAAYDASAFEPGRVAVVVGTSHSGIESAERLFVNLTASPPLTVDLRWLLASSVDHPASVLCSRLGALGPKYTLSSACASSNTAIGMAADLITDGVADLVVVAGTDTVSLSIVAGFSSLRAIGHQATAPFSNPAGLTLGEGAGVLLLESLEHARCRGATPLAEILGYGLSGDAYHETAPDPQGRGVYSAIVSALEASGLGAEQVDLVSAHGTGTDANDGAEVTGTYCIVPLTVPITSSKSFLGHTLGASGVLELILALSCAERGRIPHTANFTGVRLGCRFDVDYVHSVPRTADVDVILKNNFGFGGNNSSLLVRRSLSQDLRGGYDQAGDTVVITGIGAICAAGRSWVEVADALWQGDRRTAPSEGYIGDVGLVGPLQLPLPLKAYGRSSPMIKFGLFAAGGALADSGIDIGEQGDVGLICGVMNGAERSIEKYFASVFHEGPQFASAMHFPMTTLNAMGGAISIANKLRGFNTTMSAGQSAVSYAAALLRRSRQRGLMVVSADEMTPQLHKVFVELLHRAQAGSGEDSIAVGEGALALVLEPFSAALARGAHALVTLLALSQVQDGRLGKIDPRGAGVVRAIRQALNTAGLSVGDISAIVQSVPPLPHFLHASQAGVQTCFADTTAVISVDAVLGYCPSMSFGVAIGAAVELLHRRELPQQSWTRHAERYCGVAEPVLVLGVSLLGDITCVLLGQVAE